jgi:RNA recognition motif-containing protein
VRHEVTSGRLYVGNLSYDTSESDLLELFGGVGQVRIAEVVYHRHNQRSKGYGFVEMSSVDEARRAVEVLNDKEFMGRKLLVSGARTNSPTQEDGRAPKPAAGPTGGPVRSAEESESEARAEA